MKSEELEERRMDKYERDKERLAERADSVASSDSLVSGEGNGFLYNSKTKEVFGRGLPSWAKVLAFYFLFSAILALLWGLSMGLFLQTLDFYVPKYKQDGGLIGNNPSLGFRPSGGVGLEQSQHNQNSAASISSIYSSLIWFRHGAGGNWQQLKKNLDQFLVQYTPGYFANQGASLTKCDFENTPLQNRNPATDILGNHQDKSCEFNIEWLSDPNAAYKCIKQEDYGYRHGKPCILVKMNRVYNWVPIPYTMEEVQNHTMMPQELKTYIQAEYDSNGCGDRQGVCPWLNMVWLHCSGENDPDRENIGPVTYTPYRGFPGYFFPYRNQRGYLSPVVMVQLKNPEPGVLMNIECTAWAKNIQHNRLKRSGLVHFELIMD